MAMSLLGVLTVKKLCWTKLLFNNEKAQSGQITWLEGPPNHEKTSMQSAKIIWIIQFCAVLGYCILIVLTNYKNCTKFRQLATWVQTSLFTVKKQRFLAWTYIKQSTAHVHGPISRINWSFLARTYITQSSAHAYGLRKCINWRFLAWTYIKQSSTHVHGTVLRITGVFSRGHTLPSLLRMRTALESA